MTSSQAPSAADLLSQVDKCRAQLTATGAPFERVSVSVNGHNYLAYRNAFANLPSLINAGRVHGSREFMVYENDRWTFDRFFHAVDVEQGLAYGHLVRKYSLGLAAGSRCEQDQCRVC